MASLETLIANVAKIAGFVKVYADLPRLNAKQTAALKVNLATLHKNLDALAAYQPEVVAAKVSAAVDSAVPPPPPDTTPPYRQSQRVFGEWAHAWAKANFPDPNSLVPALVAAKAKEQGVLKEVTAAQLLGYPNTGWGGDFAYYTNWSAESTDDGRQIARVWVLGTLVAEVENADAYGLALANGIEG